MEVNNIIETVEEAAKKAFSIIAHCQAIIKNIEIFNYDKTIDTRVLYFIFAEELLNNYFVSHLLCSRIDESWWRDNNLTFGNQEPETYLKNRRYTFINTAKDATFVTFFSYTEHYIRLIYKALNFNIKTNANAIGQELIEKLSLLGSYKELWNIMCYTRNTIHSGGFHTNDNITLNYQGEEFLFKKNEAIKFLTPEKYAFLFIECLNFMKNIASSDSVKNISLIKHSYVDIQFVTLT